MQILSVSPKIVNCTDCSSTTQQINNVTFAGKSNLGKETVNSFKKVNFKKLFTLTKGYLKQAKEILQPVIDFVVKNSKKIGDFFKNIFSKKSPKA